MHRFIIEHRVYARHPSKDETVLVERFGQERWIWAEKLAQYLRDKGYLNVEVRDCSPHDPDDF